MKKLTSMVVGLVLAGSMMVVSFADEIATPADILSQLTGKSTQELYDEREDKTFGDMAKEDGVYEQFQKEMLELKKERIQERVNDGTISQERAQEVISQMENCDGSRQNLGQGLGLRLGNGQGLGKGRGNGQGFGLKDGSGAGRGNGQGFGLKDGSGAGRGNRNQ